MKSVRQVLVAVSGLVVLVAATVVITGEPARAARIDDVRVVNTAAEPVPVQGAVDVSNTSATPLFVDTGNTTRSAIGAQCFVNFDASGFGQCLLATVPAGKTLVIETITCTASVANDTPLVPIVLNMGGPPMGGGPPISLNHRLLLTRAATIAGGLDYYGLSAQVRMYAAGGSGGSTGVYVFTGAGPGTANQGGLGCAISGHMASQ